MGVQVYQTEMRELENLAIVENTPNSWYESKKMLYRLLNNLAEELDYPYVLDGMIMDDLEDFRPGMQARTEAGIRSVLQEAGLFKHEVRELVKQLELPVWNKPASCSLASRIPYGSKITKQKISQIDQAEKFLATLGYDYTRVRHNENLASHDISPM